MSGELRTDTSFFARSLAALESSGKGYIRSPTVGEALDFAAGELRFVYPPEVHGAVMRAISSSELMGYASPNGELALREAVLKALSVSSVPLEVLVTAGAKEALWIALQLIVSDRSESSVEPALGVVPRPGWRPYEIILEALGVRTVHYHPIEVARDPQVLLELLEKPQALVVLNFPNNPTGADVTQAQLDLIASGCRELGARVISDEVYRSFGVGSSLTQSPYLTEGDIVLESASKWLGAASLRVGFLLGCKRDVDRASAFRATLASGASTVSQAAALALIEDPLCQVWLSRVRRSIAHTRRALSESLDQLGVRVLSHGAIYLWLARQPTVDVGDGPIAQVMPGEAFGDPSGTRVCSARQVESVEVAAQSIARALRSQR